MNTSHSLKVVLGQILEANRLKKVLLPALLTIVNADRDISLLADCAAEATGLITSGQVGKRVAQIVKLAAGKLLCRHIILEPKNLGDLHLDAHLATNIFEELVLGAVDQFSLVNGPVVEPENNVAVLAIVGELWASDGYGLIRVGVKDGKRASSVETNAFNEAWIDIRVNHDSPDALANALPNICGRLLLNAVSGGENASLGDAGRQDLVHSIPFRAATA